MQNLCCSARCIQNTTGKGVSNLGGVTNSDKFTDYCSYIDSSQSTQQSLVQISSSTSSIIHFSDEPAHPAQES